jgi:hypothetical protein
MRKTVWDIILPSCSECETKADFISQCFKHGHPIKSYERWRVGCKPSCGRIFGGKIGKIDPETGYFVFFLDRDFECNIQDFLKEEIENTEKVWERYIKRWTRKTD